LKEETYIIDKKTYGCKICGFEWYNPKKEYGNCPDCGSEDISITMVDEVIQRPTGQSETGRRGAFGGGRIRSGPPRVCKCPNCGYEAEKTQGIPCRDIRCPECGIQLCRAD
jgi:peptide subunit release factor 1 (eRF1)